MTDPTPSKSTTAAGNPGGYAKGEQKRALILNVAQRNFGARGFDAVTTRQIAEDAGVNLPALRYYFGNKEGLYLACAREIVERYIQATGEVALAADQALADNTNAAQAAAQLKSLLGALARFLLLDEQAVYRSLFISRELASQGPACEVLFTELWQPGLALTAKLIRRAAHDRLSLNEAKIRGAMMLSSLTGLASGRTLLQRALATGDDVELIVAALEEQVNQLGSAN